MQTHLQQVNSHDLDIQVSERRDMPGVWSVEVIDYEDEGDVYVTVFYGPRSRERAEAYAKWQRR